MATTTTSPVLETARGHGPPARHSAARPGRPRRSAWFARTAARLLGRLVVTAPAYPEAAGATDRELARLGHRRARTEDGFAAVHPSALRRPL